MIDHCIDVPITAVIGPILQSGKWLQIYDAELKQDYIGLLLYPVQINNRICDTEKEIVVWNPITANVVNTSTTNIVKIKGSVLHPVPDPRSLRAQR